MRHDVSFQSPVLDAVARYDADKLLRAITQSREASIEVTASEDGRRIAFSDAALGEKLEVAVADCRGNGIICIGRVFRLNPAAKKALHL